MSPQKKLPKPPQPMLKQFFVLEAENMDKGKKILHIGYENGKMIIDHYCKFYDRPFISFMHSSIHASEEVEAIFNGITLIREQYGINTPALS